MRYRPIIAWEVFFIIGLFVGFIASGYGYLGTPILQPRIMELTNSLEETEFALANTEEELSAVRADLEGSKTRILSLNLSLTQAQSRISSLESSFGKTQSELTTTQAELSKIRADLGSANSRITSLGTELTTSKSQISSITSERDKLGSELASVTAQFSNLTRRFNSLQSRFSFLADSLLKTNILKPIEAGQMLRESISVSAGEELVGLLSSGGEISFVIRDPDGGVVFNAEKLSNFPSFDRFKFTARKSGLYTFQFENLSSSLGSILLLIEKIPS